MNTPKSINSSVSIIATDTDQKTFDFILDEERKYRLTLNKDEKSFRLDCPSGKYFENITLLNFVAEKSELEGVINVAVYEWIWRVIYALEWRLMDFSSDIFEKHTFNGIKGQYTLHTKPDSDKVFLRLPSIRLVGTLEEFESVKEFLRLLEGNQMIRFMKNTIGKNTERI